MRATGVCGTWTWVRPSVAPWRFVALTRLRVHVRTRGGHGLIRAESASRRRVTIGGLGIVADGLCGKRFDLNLHYPLLVVCVVGRPSLLETLAERCARVVTWDREMRACAGPRQSFGTLALSPPRSPPSCVVPQNTLRAPVLLFEYADRRTPSRLVGSVVARGRLAAIADLRA